ncbi:MAG: MOSC domain-containing protein [Cyclobacteriaceae bacterium]
MASRVLTDIYIYPIKSMGGIRLESSVCEGRGLQYDRRWMLIDPTGKFVSQREHAHLCLIKLSLSSDGFRLSYNDEHREIPRILSGTDYSEVQVWGDTCKAIIHDSEINAWLSQILDLDVRLVYQVDEDNRHVDPAFAKNGEVNSLSDGYPYLVLGQSSLDLLNEKLAEPILINRFRPNLVFSGSEPHEEDQWADFSIGHAKFYGAKPCSRCQVPTINQESGVMGKEPTRTLARYRNFDHKIKFGMNVLCSQEGTIAVGDQILFE